MISMQELMEVRMQQQLAHEIYRQQIMQRIPDPFPSMLPFNMPQPQMMLPSRPTLPGVDAKLENNDLWQQFHKIGTEMIITKSGRRMFPSMRVSLSGLEEEANYCVLLEMVPIGDCRYKFSGSQWVPAGGAEPQSPQRMYLHPDSPATGAHWQSQALLFNKVKLTNNTLDSSGHIVLASMHKYQPRLHIIRSSELTQLPWAPQQAFVFPETEFVAVTAYQNDRITKLKIDNNPFAKGFRESGQSRCKRKLNSSSNSSPESEDEGSSVSSCDSPHSKRQRLDCEQDSQGSLSPVPYYPATAALSPSLAPYNHRHALSYAAPHFAAAYFGGVPQAPHMPLPYVPAPAPVSPVEPTPASSSNTPNTSPRTTTSTKRNSFSISAILAY
ncbi:T-box transcription factor TBX6 [Drosophila guanche]|uniref:Blast:T-box transcription factor TBX6 n=1 Tax=Drosophila guanche TaxID=7266 RepID=A0A3B0JTD9_DROGU|nr:T-box transcription factor TBX6 [Drosophila guanche]SPP85375.1 blast:T-box transcription factor TBX6 [Drosophila guanche]